jgi:hypothetical protein
MSIQSHVGSREANNCQISIFRNGYINIGKNGDRANYFKL